MKKKHPHGGKNFRFVLNFPTHILWLSPYLFCTGWQGRGDTKIFSVFGTSDLTLHLNVLFFS